jgi:hypothetical protein
MYVKALKSKSALLLFCNQPISIFMRKCVKIDLDTTKRKGAALLLLFYISQLISRVFNNEHSSCTLK